MSEPSPQTPTPERMAEIRALRAAITPRPWRVTRDYNAITIVADCGFRQYVHGELTSDEANEPNARFIASAPQIIDELLARLDKREKDYDELYASWNADRIELVAARADAERWNWFKRFLSVEDDQTEGGQYLFLHDDNVSTNSFAPGFENTVESIADQEIARGVSRWSQADEPEPVENVIDLMEALKASLARASSGPLGASAEAQDDDLDTVCCCGYPKRYHNEDGTAHAMGSEEPCSFVAYSRGPSGAKE